MQPNHFERRIYTGTRHNFNLEPRYTLQKRHNKLPVQAVHQDLKKRYCWISASKLKYGRQATNKPLDLSIQPTLPRYKS